MLCSYPPDLHAQVELPATATLLHFHFRFRPLSRLPVALARPPALLYLLLRQGRLAKAFASPYTPFLWKHVWQASRLHPRLLLALSSWSLQAVLGHVSTSVLLLRQGLFVFFINIFSSFL